MKAFKHPQLLALLDNFVLDTGRIYVITRSVELLTWKDMPEDMRIQGIHDILMALDFLHEKAHMAHGRIVTSSILVSTSNKRWLLGSMELCQTSSDATKDLTDIETLSKLLLPNVSTLMGETAREMLGSRTFQVTPLVPLMHLLDNFRSLDPILRTQTAQKLSTTIERVSAVALIEMVVPQALCHDILVDGCMESVLHAILKRTSSICANPDQHGITKEQCANLSDVHVQPFVSHKLRSRSSDVRNRLIRFWPDLLDPLCFSLTYPKFNSWILNQLMSGIVDADFQVHIDSLVALVDIFPHLPRLMRAPKEDAAIEKEKSRLRETLVSTTIIPYLVRDLISEPVDDAPKNRLFDAYVSMWKRLFLTEEKKVVEAIETSLLSLVFGVPSASETFVTEFIGRNFDSAASLEEASRYISLLSQLLVHDSHQVRQQTTRSITAILNSINFAQLGASLSRKDAASLMFEATKACLKPKTANFTTHGGLSPRSPLLPHQPSSSVDMADEAEPHAAKVLAPVQQQQHPVDTQKSAWEDDFDSWEPLPGQLNETQQVETPTSPVQQSTESDRDARRLAMKQKREMRRMASKKTSNKEPSVIENQVQ